MVMRFNMKYRIASILAVLMMVTIMSSIAQANENGISLSQTGSNTVSLHFAEGAVDWKHDNAVDLLLVFVGGIDLCCEGRTPIAGHHTLENNAVTFTPAFGFEPGQDYVARVRMSGEVERFLPFRITSQAAQINAAVTQVFPSGETLPENILRFYIHFSTPMTPHVAFDFIKLRDTSGNVDDAAFMRFKQELWNEDRTRLTVLIDPGRIKREVATNVELGPALLAGKQYSFSVDGGWPSADGKSILPMFSRTFTVSDALRERPDVRLWHVTSPCHGTKEPLTITLDRPFDRHLLNKDIQVVTEDGRFINGIINVGKGETSWSLTPNEPWPPKDLQVVANTELEDVAGNNFQDLLDHVQTNEVGDVALSSLSIKLMSCPE